MQKLHKEQITEMISLINELTVISDDQIKVLLNDLKTQGLTNDLKTEIRDLFREEASVLDDRGKNKTAELASLDKQIREEEGSIQIGEEKINQEYLKEAKNIQIDHAKEMKGIETNFFKKIESKKNEDDTNQADDIRRLLGLV